LFLGFLLEEARTKLGMTQQELTEKCGTNKSYISRIENNESDIRLSTLLKIVQQDICLQRISAVISATDSKKRLILFTPVFTPGFIIIPRTILILYGIFLCTHWHAYITFSKFTFVIYAWFNIHWLFTCAWIIAIDTSRQQHENES
jgi:transcriptional regulator with XRE-family HTH domain